MYYIFVTFFVFFSKEFFYFGIYIRNWICLLAHATFSSLLTAYYLENSHFLTQPANLTTDVVKLFHWSSGNNFCAY